MEDNLLIWVDENDNEIGYGHKMETHIDSHLHRAFSIFVFDRTSNKMLLQKRASHKYHSGGLWSNACCSHPRKGEGMKYTLIERLKIELGLAADFEIVSPTALVLLPEDKNMMLECGSFHYHALFSGLSENEIDHVYLLCLSGGCSHKEDIVFNLNEIEEIKWVSIEELEDWLSNKPNDFTAWFAHAYSLVVQTLQI